ncbi:hypothetical protein [Lishizhenia sp.]|uniref:hypothetical protein n=1 Tax=Lishizhenia sp. TaxID=2497594 RepID=UPI00299D2A9F|nr:hypothetical protein [Lishizhenia sp.]MDX1445447.1 hypothetical protein [Lishizhenia sp.]
MQKLLTLGLVSLSTFFINAQAVIEDRIEVETKETSDETISSFGTAGFVFSNEKVERKERTLNFDIYSTDLEVTESFQKTIDRKYSYERQFTDDKAIYQIHFNKRGEYEFFILDVEEQELDQFSGMLPDKMSIQEMKVMNGVCYLRGISKREDYIIKLDLDSHKMKSIPIRIKNVKSKKIRVNNMQMLEDANEILLSLDATISKHERDTYLFLIDNEGDTDLFKIYSTTKDKEKLIDYSFSKIGEDAYSISGTYSKQSTSTSEGLFFGIIDNQKVKSINFYNFLDLDDFLSYLPERKQEKIEKKKSRKKKRGKELTLSYNIATHDVIKKEDGSFIFIGEAYYATYRTVTTVNANGTTSTRQEFDGYRYTHAVIAKFDLNGDLVWDNCFEMNPGYKPYHVKLFLEVNTEDSNNFSMMFTTGTTIVSKSVDLDEGDITREVESEKIELKENEKVKYSRTELSYWFEDNFLLFGIQRIKDKDAPLGSRRRTIFFISKVNYEI